MRSNWLFEGFKSRTYAVNQNGRTVSLRLYPYYMPVLAIPELIAQVFNELQKLGEGESFTKAHLTATRAGTCIEIYTEWTPRLAERLEEQGWTEGKS